MTQVQLAADDPLFAGHFPGNPILPGIAHLALVERVLVAHHGDGARVASVRSLRLRHTVHPGDTLDLTVELRPEAVRFTLRRREEVVSNGSAVIAGQGDPHTSHHEPAGRQVTGAPSGPQAANAVGRAPADIASLLPHRAPMALVMEVVANDDRGATCRCRIPLDNSLVAGGRAPWWAGLEMAAQTAAVHETLIHRGAGDPPGPRLGYLVGVRDAHGSRLTIPAGDTAVAKVQLTGHTPPLSVYQVELEVAGQPCLHGTISALVPAVARYS